MTDIVPFDQLPGLGRHFRRMLVIAGMVAVSACSQVASNLPLAPSIPAASADIQTDLPPYRIQRGDVLAIKLYQSPELNEEITVRPDGHISTALVKDQRAFGRTVPELADVLRKDYSAFVREPALTVVVKSFAPERVYVGGEVTQPGEFLTLPPSLTLSQAIARAGGLKLTASRDNIIILRRGPGDEPQVFATNYAGVRTGSDPSGDVHLANYDVVFVPRTSISEFYLYFNQYIQQFVPVSWGFSYVLNSQSSVVRN